MLDLFVSEKTLTGHDPANYVLAVKYGFSIENERPHSPGSPLFIEVWKATSSVFGVEPHRAIILINTLLFIVSLPLLFSLTRRLFDQKTAVLACAFYAINPITWYFTAIGEVYIYEGFFALGIFWLFFFCKNRTFWIATFLLGLSGGFRPSSTILLFPAILVLLYFRRRELGLWTMLTGVMTFTLGLAAWIIPYYYSSGKGFSLLVKAFTEAGDLSSTIPENAAAFASWLFWGLHIAIVLILLRARTILKWIKGVRHSQTGLVLFVWMAVPSLFFLTMHYAKGYLLLILPCLAIAIARIVVKHTSMRPKMAIVTISISSLVLFFISPFIVPAVESSFPQGARTKSERLETAVLRTFSFFAATDSHIRTIDRAMMESDTLLKQNCPPQSVVVVDRSAGGWAYPRSVQVSRPELFLLSATKNDGYFLMYHDSSPSRILSTDSLPAFDNLYYLVDRRLPASKLIPGYCHHVSEAEKLILYTIRDSAKQFLQWVTNSGEQSP